MLAREVRSSDLGLNKNIQIEKKSFCSARVALFAARSLQPRAAPARSLQRSFQPRAAPALRANPTRERPIFPARVFFPQKRKKIWLRPIEWPWRLARLRAPSGLPGAARRAPPPTTLNPGGAKLLCFFWQAGTRRNLAPSAVVSQRRHELTSVVRAGYLQNGWYTRCTNR